MLFARRLSQLVVEAVLVDGIHQFSPDFDRHFMTLPHARFSAYLFLHRELPISVTSPVYLQPWGQRSSGRWDNIPSHSAVFVAAAYLWF